MAFLGRAMQNIAQQAFPGGTGGMRALPATSGIGRLLSGLAGTGGPSPTPFAGSAISGIGRLLQGAPPGGVAATGGSVSQPPTNAPAQTVSQTPAIPDSSLQPGTNGVLGLISRAVNNAAPTQNPTALLLDALRNQFPQSRRVSGASPTMRGITSLTGF